MMRQPLSSGSPPDPSRLFDELVETHYAKLCNFAYRLVGSRDVAEDIVQDVFSHVWCRWAEFDISDPLRYFYQAIRNRAANDRRQRDVRRRWRDHIAAQAQGHDTAADFETTDFAAAVGRAVDELPERRRLIFTMSRDQGLSYAEIARALGISVKTVETQMTRALQTLRIRLARYLAVTVTVAALAAWG